MNTKLFSITLVIALVLSVMPMMTVTAPIPPPPDPMINVQFVGVTEPDLWGRTYDQYEISYVDGDGSVWYRVTSAQGIPATSGTSCPGSAWTATGFVTPTGPRIVKLLKHLDPDDPFCTASSPYDANPRQICVEFSNNNAPPWFGPICVVVPIQLARGECVDLGQIRLCLVGISDPSEPDAYRNTKKGWYCWKIEYIQGDDWTKSCWFEVQPPSFATAFPYTGFVTDNPTFKTRKVWTADDEITLKWTGKNQQVKFAPTPYGPITAEALP